MQNLPISFLKSSAKLSQCPLPDRPEYAFIGRSNVGKSTLINVLANHKNLAKTSGRPGKTQLINHFDIGEKWYLVDLPGYGYAQVSKGAKRQFQKINEDYILERGNLITLFVLIDSRLKPQPIDLEFLEWLGEHEVPFALVFTKTDKLKAQERARNIQVFQQKMLETWDTLPPFFSSAAPTKAGREEILDYITRLNEELLQP